MDGKGLNDMKPFDPMKQELNIFFQRMLANWERFPTQKYAQHVERSKLENMKDTVEVSLSPKWA